MNKGKVEKETNEIEKEMREFILEENPHMKEISGTSMKEVQKMVDEAIEHVKERLN